MQSHFVQVEGARMHYTRAGSGPAVVLLHGLVGSALNWSCNIPYLARTHTVYALDLLNMGGSARVPSLDSGLAATARIVAVWMRTVGLTAPTRSVSPAASDPEPVEPPHLVAHSHGGAIAILLAARHPELVRSLTLFAPANPWSRSADWLLRFYSHFPGRQLASLAPYLPEPFQLYALGRMYGDPRRATRELLEGYLGGLRIPGTLPHILSIIQTWHGQMRLLERVPPTLGRVPTLLVWGDRDRAVSLGSGLHLHRQWPGSEWAVLPGAGHVPFQELPELVNPLMLAWLRRAAASVQPLP